MADKLETIFEKQHELQTYLWGDWFPFIDRPNADDKHLFTKKFMWQQFVNQQILAIQEETVEVMRETTYKNPDCTMFGWKKTQEVHPQQMREELADLLHFFINLCLAAGMTADDLFKAYMDKNHTNHQRQKEGY